MSAMIRRTECDDIHVGSCVTPGSVVIPVALAMARRAGVRRALRPGRRRWLCGRPPAGRRRRGRSRAHERRLANLLRRAADGGGDSRLCLELDRERMECALALAAAGAGGRAGRPPGGLSGRWFSIGEAVSKGWRAAVAAGEGFRGDPGLISSEWLSAVMGHGQTRPGRSWPGPGRTHWPQSAEAVRGGPPDHNAVVAFRRILARGLPPEALTQIQVGVPTVNLAVVTRAASPQDRLSLISNMPLQIAAAALRPDFLYDVERDGEPGADLAAFAERVKVVADPALDAHLPQVWAGRVTVIADRARIDEICTGIDGDPGNETAAAMVLRDKLARMVPESERPVCAALVEVDESGREARIGRLYDAMIAAFQRASAAPA